MGADFLKMKGNTGLLCKFSQRINNAAYDKESVPEHKKRTE